MERRLKSVYVLGRCRVCDEKGTPCPLPTRHVRRLLLLLVMHPKHGLDRHQLADALWPGTPPESSLQSLRTALRHLRAALGEAVSADRSRIRLDRQAVSLDLDMFESAIAEKRWEEAVTVYQGDLGGPDAPDLVEEEFDQLWDYALVTKLALDNQDALLALAMEAWGANDPSRAETWFERALSGDRADEPAFLSYAQALVKAGRDHEAFRVFRRLLKVKDARREPLSPGALEFGRSVRDRLRKTAHRSSDEPKLAASDSVEVRRLKAGPAVGLERVLRAVDQALSSHRLVTLVGPGGIGKTRAALEAASEFGPLRASGSLWIDLSALADGSDARPVIDAAVPDDLLESDTLVVLDNCEPVLESASAWVEGALSSSGRVQILATSRTPLGLTYGQVVPVQTLERPAELLRLRLEQRGTVVSLESTDAQELLDATGGLPLAVEMAASQIAAQGLPATLAAWRDGRHDDLASDERTLAALIERSFVRLSREAQDAFLALCVFPGPFTPEEAALASQEGLGELLSTSMVVDHESQGTVRYRILPPVRQWGLRRSDPAVAGALRHRVARGMTDGLGESYEQLRTGRLFELQGIVAPSLANFLAAHDWLVDSDPVLACRLAFLLAPALVSMGQAQTAVALYDRCMDRALAVSPEEAGRTATNLGPAAKALGQLDRALWAYDTARRVAEAEGKHREIGVCRLNASFVRTDQGDYDGAEVDLDEAEKAFDDYGRTALQRDSDFARLNVLKSRARLAMHRGDLELSRQFGLAGLKLARDISDRHSAAVILNNLGDCAFLAGELELATDHFRENIEIAESVGDGVLVAHGRLGLAVVELSVGKTSAAAQDLNLALHRFETAADERDMLACGTLAAALLACHGEPLRAVKLASACEAQRQRQCFSGHAAVDSASARHLADAGAALGPAMTKRVGEVGATLTRHETLRLVKEALMLV